MEASVFDCSTEAASAPVALLTGRLPRMIENVTLRPILS
jgi:hypothetical protein